MDFGVKKMGLSEISLEKPAINQAIIFLYSTWLAFCLNVPKTSKPWKTSNHLH